MLKSENEQSDRIEISNHEDVDDDLRVESQIVSSTVNIRSWTCRLSDLITPIRFFEYQSERF